MGVHDAPSIKDSMKSVGQQSVVTVLVFVLWLPLFFLMFSVFAGILGAILEQNTALLISLALLVGCCYIFMSEHKRLQSLTASTSTELVCCFSV